MALKCLVYTYHAFPIDTAAHLFAGTIGSFTKPASKVLGSSPVALRSLCGTAARAPSRRSSLLRGSSAPTTVAAARSDRLKRVPCVQHAPGRGPPRC